MAQIAFVMIEAEVGKARQVAEALRARPDVSAVHVVTGPYSLVAIVHGEDVKAVGEIVTTEIHTVPGITRTTTMLALD